MNSAKSGKLTKNDEKLFRQLYENANEIYRFVAIRNRYDSTPRDYGTSEIINMTEAHMVVDICDNESITVSKLAEKSDRTPSAVSQIVSKVEKKGYI
ncbi:MAG: MarR family transcriptional regulator [Clostridiaceae bacterium]|nr:MarR family transcriptional regulator [Clostridiaceae bacterium]